MNLKTQTKINLVDPSVRALMRNECSLRTYQSDALRQIYSGVQRKTGGSYAVTFPRQSGKNETQAQLESAVMSSNLRKGGTIVKLLPTEKNQGSISRKRLTGVLRGRGKKTRCDVHTSKNLTAYGSTELRCLSASPNAAIVGATADLMLEVDEAQMIPPAKFDREAAPMAASTDAVRVFWGTVWDDRTLLSRESRRALSAGSRHGNGALFRTDAALVGREVPEYAGFVRSQVETLGRDHPAIRTQYFCEEISDLTGMFTPDRLQLMRGSHRPAEAPEPDHCYVFLIDIAGSDELTSASRRNYGFSDRRDATVLTICDVSLPEDSRGDSGDAVWKVAARRYYRNLSADQLEANVAGEIEYWGPRRVILDHTGLGCMLSDYLSRRFPEICAAYDITPANKTRMAWEFLAMVSSGRWQEYAVDEAEGAWESDYKPRRDRCEVLRDPAMLQRMFFRELRACRMEPTLDARIVRWGVPDGTRDQGNGRLIHDDLVMSAALCVFAEGPLPILTKLPDFDPCYFDPVDY